MQEGKKDEVNLGLERKQWHEYLIELEMLDLLECIEQANINLKEEDEPIEAAI